MSAPWGGDEAYEELEPVREERVRPAPKVELKAGFHDPPLRPPSPRKEFRHLRRENYSRAIALAPIEHKKMRPHKAFQNLPDGSDVQLGPLPIDVLAELKVRETELAKHVDFLETKKKFYEENTSNKIEIPKGGAGGPYDRPLLEHSVFGLESHMIGRRHRARFQAEPKLMMKKHKDYRERSSRYMLLIEQEGYPTKETPVDTGPKKKKTAKQLRYERDLQRKEIRRQKILQNKKKQQKREKEIRARATAAMDPTLKRMLQIPKPSVEELYVIGRLETAQKAEYDKNLIEARAHFRSEDSKVRIALRKARNKAKTEGIDLDIQETGLRGFVLSVKAYTQYTIAKIKRVLGVKAIRRMIRDVEITMIMWGLTEENLRDILRSLGLPVKKYKKRKRMTAAQRARWYFNAVKYVVTTVVYGTDYVVRFIYCKATGKRFVARTVGSRAIKEAFSSSNLEAAQAALEDAAERGSVEGGDDSDEISYFNDGESVSHTGESLDGSIVIAPVRRRAVLSLFMSEAALDRMQARRERLELLLEQSKTYQMLRSRAIQAQQRLVEASAPHIERIKQSQAYIAVSENTHKAVAVVAPHAARAKAQTLRASVVARDKCYVTMESIYQSAAMRRGRAEADKMRRAIAASEAAKRAGKVTRASRAFGRAAKRRASRTLGGAAAAAKSTVATVTWPVRALAARGAARVRRAAGGFAGAAQKNLLSPNKSAKVGAAVVEEKEEEEEVVAAAAEGGATTEETAAIDESPVQQSKEDVSDDASAAAVWRG